MSDTQSDKQIPFVGYVRHILEEADVRSTNEYALKSFLDFTSASKTESVSKDVLTSWIATLFIKGKSAATAKRYVCRLHTAWLDWIRDSSADPAPDPFDGLLSLTVPESQVESALPKSNLNLIKRLVSPDTYQGVMGKWRAIFFFLLYNPALSVEELVSLRFGETPDFCPQSVEILESMDSSKGRRYVFPLGQPDKRMPQMVREVTEHLEGLLSAVGMTFTAGFARERITAMWIAAAVGLGFNAGEIRAVVSVVPDEYRILQNVVPLTISEQRRQELICRVANRINDITTRWYVVNMRDKVVPDDVKDSLREHFPSLFPHIGFFYPTRQAWRLTRKKGKVKIEVPFIPGLLFIFLLR